MGKFKDRSKMVRDKRYRDYPQNLRPLFWDRQEGLMEKVVLVIPEDNIGAEPMVYPPLGLLYIAAVLEPYYEVEVFDARDRDIYPPMGDIFLFTAVTPQINKVIQMAWWVSDMCLGAFTVLGGPHATWCPEEMAKHFDAVVVGEGEEIILDILKNRKKGTFKANGKGNIDDIPFPTRHLLPKSKIVSEKLWDGYRFSKEDSPIATTLITSRGCAWKCAFCANIPQPIRYRHPHDIIREIMKLEEDYNCHYFRFLDDNFIGNVDRLKTLSHYLALLNIKFRCSARSDLLTGHICEMLVKSGCKEIGFGVESGDDKVLKIIHKNETVADHKRAVNLAKSYGLMTKTFLMAGLPGETWESIELTKQFMEEVKPDKWSAALFTPFPGCDIAKNPKKYGVEIVDSNYDSYIESYPTKSVMRTKEASQEELGAHYEELLRYLTKEYHAS